MVWQEERNGRGKKGQDYDDNLGNGREHLGSSNSFHFRRPSFDFDSLIRHVFSEQARTGERTVDVRR